MATDHIIAIDSGAEVEVPAKLSIPRPAPLAAHSPNASSSPAAAPPARNQTTGFSALSALLDESPRTRMAAHEGDGAPAAEAGAEASFMGAMDVSGLVAIGDDDDEAEPAAEAEASFCMDMDVTALVDQATAALDQATAALDESIAAAEAAEEDDDADVCI